VHAIILAGGIPFLCDVNESSLEMTKETIFKVVNENRQNIAAVCPTRIFGSANDFSDLVEFCNDLELPVLVDAAGAYPGQPNSWKFNQTAKYEVFSLHATKVFGIGEGGLVVGAFNDIEEVRNRSNFGLSGNPQDGFTDGINAKADEFTAARAIARFPTFGADILSRAAFAKEYDSFFKTLSSVSVLPFNERGTYSLFPVRFNSEQQLLDFQEATEHIILTRRYYFPSLSEGYRGTARIKLSSNLSVSNTAAQTTLCLPVYTSYSSEVVPRLLDLFSKIIGEK
jgi:dTDP-4-amino-4,6-dideoxygalactose transaminase